MTEILHKDLSYEVVGALFDVQKAIGAGHRELIYQRAVAEALKDRKLTFKEQVKFPVVFLGKVLTQQRVDFLIEEKIILEIKSRVHFTQSDYRQLTSYLVASTLGLGILAVFTPDGVRYRRVLNLPNMTNNKPESLIS